MGAWSLNQALWQEGLNTSDRVFSTVLARFISLSSCCLHDSCYFLSSSSSALLHSSPLPILLLFAQRFARPFYTIMALSIAILILSLLPFTTASCYWPNGADRNAAYVRASNGSHPIIFPV
jgi:hypothetical protein